MSDIFISYAREDRTRVETLANALQASGWSVWWDPHIPTGKRFDEVIEQALSETKCIIVVWSKNSVSSSFVRAEASDGADRQILLPVLFDDVKIPLAFRQIQAARLVGWQGSTQDSEFVKLLNDISILAGKKSAPPPTAFSPVNINSEPIVEPGPPPAKETAPFKLSKGLILAGIAAAALLIALFVWNYQKQNGHAITGTNGNSPPREKSPEVTPTPTPVRGDDSTSIKTVSDLVKHLRIRRVAFFQGDCPEKPPEGPLGQPSIQSDQVQKTRWFLEFEHPKPFRQIGFQIFARFEDPERKSRGQMKLDKAVIRPSSTHSWFCSDPPGLSGQRRAPTIPLRGLSLLSLPTGTYKVEFFFRETESEPARKVDEVSINIR